MVFTTLHALTWYDTTAIDHDPAERIVELKKQPGKNISVNGSATLVRLLLGTGVIDALRLFVMPVVVGAGVRLLDAVDEVALKLVDSHTYGNGVVSLTSAPIVR